MDEVIIVLVPKPGKDPQDCASFWTISLLNMDAKNFAKVLTSHLSQLIEDLVEVDQTCFMPGKGTDINIRRLYLNLSFPYDNPGTRDIASLEADKAFDSIEWLYLWEVLRCFGFGPNFLHGLQLLYRAPRARVCTNNWLSDSFRLHRGTRQGCPLSTRSFALALEPLAILIRDALDVLGLKVGKLEEKLSLYADDALLYLNDTGSSLLAALRIFDTFGGIPRDQNKLVQINSFPC